MIADKTAKILRGYFIVPHPVCHCFNLFIRFGYVALRLSFSYLFSFITYSSNINLSKHLLPFIVRWRVDITFNRFDYISIFATCWRHMIDQNLPYLVISMCRSIIALLVLFEEKNCRVFPEKKLSRRDLYFTW